MTILKENRKGGTLVYTIHKDLVPFVEAGVGLYAWTTESRYKGFKGDGQDIIKFGQYGTSAANGTTPQDTILGYLGTTTEPVVILWAKKFTEDDIKVGTPFQIEQIVNKKIGLRYEDGKSTEQWYTSVDVIREKVNEELYGSTKLDSYSLRPSQQAASDKMVPYFKEGGTDFLLGAIMRYGKNFTFLTTCSKLLDTNGNILVLTNKPGVFDSLKHDINSHVYFDGWEYIELKSIKDKNKLKLNPNKISVIACSKQLADNLISGEATRRFLGNQVWDFSFFDECHSGTDTDNFKSLNESLDIKHRVWASGTPFRTAASGGFKESNSFYYGYVEQQKDKERGIAPHAVTLDTYLPAINPDFVSNPNFTDEEGFTLTKLFAFKGGKFTFGGEVREFLKEVLGKADTKSKFSPMRICEGKLDHTTWLLPPDIEMTDALSVLIEDIAPEYKVLNATGNNITSIDKVHEAIAKYDKTITLTNMRFIEGTTVPEWTGAFVISDTESVEKYFQFIFRVASPAEGKDKAFVFDFDPERKFQMVFDMANAHARNNNSTDSQEAIREWLDFMNVFRAGEGPTFKKLEVGDILERIQSSNYNSASLITNALKYVFVDKIDAETIERLKTVPISTKVKMTTKMVENNITKGINYSQTKGETNTEPKDIDESTATVKRIASLVAAAPVLSWLSEETTLEGIVESVEDDVFEAAVNVKKDIVRLLITKGIIDTNFINLYI
jgi:hypothetical protein